MNILMIGGSTVDFVGTSDTYLVKKQSNIGEVATHLGGVMRNTCENLVNLGNKCSFITALGKDTYGNKMKEYMGSLGVDLYMPESELPTSTNLVINDTDHSMNIGLCDTRIIESIDIDYLKKNADLLKKFNYIVIDCNLSEEVINYLFDTYRSAKFICEGISPKKIIRYKNNLNKIFLLKCNIYEAQALMDIKLGERDLVGGLLAKGVKNVVVSNSSKDIYYGSDNRDIGLVHVDEITEYESTSGCGAALLSGIIHYFISNKTLKDAVEFGNKLAAITLKSPGPTTSEISKFAK